MRQYFKARHERHKQLIKFILIGLLAVLVDLGFYYLFLNTFPEMFFETVPREVAAKFLSFLCGSLVTYNLNKYWTWRQRDRSHKRLAKFLFLYGCSLALNVATNTFALYVLYKYSFLEIIPFKYFIAFAVATAISAAVNFTGQKFWVFQYQETGSQ